MINSLIICLLQRTVISFSLRAVLSTLMALRGFLSSVDVWMLGQVCPLIEGLSTLTALIQLLSSVSPQGLGEGGVPDKSFLTGVTLTVLICLQCGSTGGR